MENDPGSILITSNFSNRTGYAWTAFFRVFNHLARSAHERGVDVVLSFATIEHPITILDPDIPFNSFQFDPLRLTVGDLIRLRRNIHRHRIRHAYLTDLPSWHWLYSLMRLWGVKSIVTHRHISVQDPHPPQSERGIRRFAKARIQESRLFGSDRVLACSRFVKDRLVRKACCPEERVQVINYGLPERQFSPPRPRADAAVSPIRIFTAARATRVKGIHHLIAATGLVSRRSEMPPFEVSFAGSGPDLEEFQEQVRGLGIEDRFRFLGYVDDVSSRLDEADIVVIPSVWGDAFPYSVLEAMAHGKAIVASRAGGIPEQIGEPPAGILVPPGDSQALADGLELLIRDGELRRELGQKAFERARRKFREEDYFEAVTNAVFHAFGLADLESASRGSQSR